MNRCFAWRYSVANWFMGAVCTRCPAWRKASCNAFAKPHVLLPSLPTRMTVSADCGPLLSAIRGIEREVDRVDDPRFLEASEEQIRFHRNLVTQATRLFGSRHFNHYDFLFSLSDRMGGNMVSTSAVWSMDGEWLVIANTQPGREGGAPTTRKTYYKKG